MIFSKQWTVAVVLAIGLDQLTKWVASSKGSFYTAVEIIPSYLSFQLVHNYGAAYGIFQNQTMFLIGVSGVVVAVIYYYRDHLGTSRLTRFGTAMLLAGAIGNMIDRIRVGYVIDFINIHIIPVFNIADILINIGVICFVSDALNIPAYFRRQINQRRKSKERKKE